MGDDNPGHTPPMGKDPDGVDAAALLRKPAIIAAIGAVFGLGMGIVIGRATVGGPAPSRGAPPSKSEAALTPVVEEEEPEPQRSNEYRAQLGRRVPGGRGGRGFEKHRISARPVARLAEKEGVIRFDLDASASDYLLTAVIHLEGAKPGNLVAQLDGKPLAAWELEPGWQMYSARVSQDRLAQADHLLHVAPALPGGGEVSIDSLAVFPAASSLNIGMGAEAVGLVIDGFSNLGGRSVWSVGPRSVVGVALAPAAGPYRLTVRGSAFGPIAPLSVSCKVNGKNVGSAEVGAKVADLVWQIDANMLRDGVNRIEFAYPITKQPAAVDPTSKDKRELAMRFARLELAPNH